MFTYEQFGAFDKGFSNGLLRQETYTTICVRTFSSTLMSHAIFSLVFVKGYIAIVEDSINANNGDDSIEEMTIYTF